eukprot:g7042.t1
MVRFNSSGAIVRMKCGHGNPGCNVTCNPTGDLAISCNNKADPHLHHNSYDMSPVLFTVIPARMAVNCGPHAGDGTPIPCAISIGTQSDIRQQALQELFRCNWEEFTLMDDTENKLRAHSLIDVSFVAGVEKKKWGQQGRWGHHVLALSRDATVVNHLSKANSPPARSGPLAINVNLSTPAKASGKGKGKKRLAKPDNDDGDDIDADQDDDVVIVEGEGQHDVAGGGEGDEQVNGDEDYDDETRMTTMKMMAPAMNKDTMKKNKKTNMKKRILADDILFSLQDVFTDTAESAVDTACRAEVCRHPGRHTAYSSPGSATARSTQGPAWEGTNACRSSEGVATTTASNATRRMLANATAARSTPRKGKGPARATTSSAGSSTAEQYDLATPTPPPAPPPSPIEVDDAGGPPATPPPAPPPRDSEQQLEALDSDGDDDDERLSTLRNYPLDIASFGQGMDRSVGKQHHMTQGVLAKRNLVWSPGLDLADTSIAAVPLCTLIARRVSDRHRRQRHVDLGVPTQVKRRGPQGSPTEGNGSGVPGTSVGMFPRSTGVGRILMDADGRPKTFKATAYHYCGPYWRVEYPDGHWEEFTKREVEQGIGVAAQPPPSA